MNRRLPFLALCVLSLLLVMLALLWLSGRSLAAADPICVKPGGGSGCYATINAALAAAQPGDTIRVAAGLYQENVVITQTVVLQGGWNAAWAARDPALFVTTLRPADPLVAVVSVLGQFGDTAAVAPTIDGFTISGGRSDNHGGGLRIRDSDALVSHNVITDNVGYLLGGGVWVQRGAPRFEDNRIQNNYSDGLGQVARGGGIQLENTRAMLTGNLIAGNGITATGGYGGGVDVQGGAVTLAQNTIRGNRGPTLGSGYGGGLSAQSARLTLAGNTLQGNRATLSGAGRGGGLFIDNSPAFTMSNNTLTANVAGYAQSLHQRPRGGGAYLENSRGDLRANLFSGNTADGQFAYAGAGGGLAVVASTIRLRGGQIVANRPGSSGWGSGIYSESSRVSVDAVRIQDNLGGGVASDTGHSSCLTFASSPFSVTNSLITGNDNSIAGAVYADPASPGLLVNNTFAANGAGLGGAAVGTRAPLTLLNTIVTHEATGIRLFANVTILSGSNDFWDNGANGEGFTPDATDLLVDPLLTVGFHLGAGSPLLDAGQRVEGRPGRDIDGEPRVMVGPSGLYRVDIGADEFPGPAQRAIDLATEAADLTIIGPGGQDPTNGVNDWIGSALLGSDFSGDGRPDLVVSAHDWAVDPNNPPRTTGQAFGLLNFGTRITGTIDLLTDPADFRLASLLNLQHVGSELVGGDLNDDGRDDLIIGSSQDDNAGGGTVTPTVFVLWGGPALVGTRTLTDTTPADYTLRAPGQDFYAFAAKNALAAGDLSGDGVDDLIVGDALADDGGLVDAGAVFVILGRNTLAGGHDLAVSAADWAVYGPAANAGLGSVALGRVGTGSQVNLVARTDTAAYVLFGPRSSGAVHLSALLPDVLITGLQAGGVAVLDLTGDGQEDVVLGSGDKLYVIPGPLAQGQTFNAADRAVLTLTGATLGILAGGDVAGDRHPDLIAGAPALKRVYVIPGGLDAGGSLPIVEAAAIVADHAIANLLFSDLGAGDLDLDGRADLLIGNPVDVPWHPNEFTDAGQVHVLYGETLAPVRRSVYLPLVSD